VIFGKLGFVLEELWNVTILLVSFDREYCLWVGAFGLVSFPLVVF